MGWIDSLRGSVVGLDTTPLIYFIEENPALTPFFLTNDIRLPSLSNLKTLLLDDLKKES